MPSSCGNGTRTCGDGPLALTGTSSECTVATAHIRKEEMTATRPAMRACGRLRKLGSGLERDVRLRVDEPLIFSLTVNDADRGSLLCELVLAGPSLSRVGSSTPDAPGL